MGKFLRKFPCSTPTVPHLFNNPIGVYVGVLSPFGKHVDCPAHCCSFETSGFEYLVPQLFEQHGVAKPDVSRPKLMTFLMILG
jgi:hypothetical protein